MEPVDLDLILLAEDPEEEYLVDELLCKGQIWTFAGDPGVGKSFLMYYIAISIALGLPVLGRKAEKGRVLYFDEENSKRDLNQYLRWIWRGLGQPETRGFNPKYFDNHEGLFLEHFTVAKYTQHRYDYMTECAATIKPALIVVDTVASVCDIEDENSNGEAMKALKKLRQVRSAGGDDTVMVLLKHAKFTHDPSLKQTIRGAKCWKDQTDGMIFQKLAQGKPRTDKLKNCKLVNDKVRAFGLRDEIIITPRWVGDGKEKGVVLHG